MTGENNRKQSEQPQTKRFVPEQVVSQFTGREVRTLQKDRLFRRGFPFYKIGRQVLYDLAEVEGIIRSQRVSTEAHVRG